MMIFVCLSSSLVVVNDVNMYNRGFNTATPAPQIRPIYGVEEKQEAFQGNGIIEWKYLDSPEVTFVENTPAAEESDTHGCCRKEPETWKMMKIFVETGFVQNTCDQLPNGQVRGLFCHQFTVHSLY